MNPTQDTEFAQWFNRYCDPNNIREFTYAEMNRAIKHGLKAHGISADEANISHCRNLLQMTGQIQAVVNQWTLPVLQRAIRQGLVTLRTGSIHPRKETDNES